MSNFNTTQMLPVGTVLDNRYRIERYLASGGFGNTYEATDNRFNSHVAVKEFYMRGTNHRSADHTTVEVSNAENRVGFLTQLDKFRREAQRIFNIRNDHVVHVIDLFDANGTSYYVMDLIEGESLSARVKRGSMSEAEVRNVADQLLDALAAVHDAGFYHLDVKPANIMIDEKGHCTLIDFGASKQMSAEERTTMSTSGIAYTPGYAPLEQVAMRTKSIGPWTDFYAMGATLFHLLTQLTPPEIEPDDIDDDSRMFDYSPRISIQMQQAISRMMNPSRRLRPKNVEEMRALLKGITSRPISTVVDEETIISSPRAALSFDAVTQVRGSQPEKRFTIPSKFQIYKVRDIEFKMIEVEHGSFSMGATSEQEEPDFDEKPVHNVTLNSFHIGETEVTQALWNAIMGDNPSFFKGDDLPVESVSWVDCQSFITKLNEETKGQRPDGRVFRLPTEAEWEFAARGGNYSRNTQYAGSSSIDAVAWFDDNSSQKTHDVAQKSPNELGLHDMSGNVWEWCHDWYDENFYSKSPSTNPCDAKRSSFEQLFANNRVVRGGSWSSNVRSCRVAFRHRRPLEDKYKYLGFRLAI